MPRDLLRVILRLDRGGSKIGRRCVGRGERLNAEGGIAELMDLELLER